MGSESTPDGPPSDSRAEINLAKWSTRFWAWLVDFIIVATAFEVIFAIAYTPLALFQGFNDMVPWITGTRYAVQSLMFFAYWIYFESTSGQSIGKRLLKVKTTNMVGDLADVKSIAISAGIGLFLTILAIVI